MRGRPPTIREEVILDAARDVFREQGHAATTAGIAKRARVSEGILFYRYQSREALLAAVILRETEPPDSLRDIAKTAAGERSVAENLERIVGDLLEAVSRVHPFLELAMTSPKSGEIHRLVFARGRKPPPQRIVELLAGYLDAEIRLGRARAINTSAAARAMFGGCIDFVRAEQGAGDDERRRAFVRGLADLLVHGIANTAPSRDR